MMKEITDKKEWNAILEQIENYDFYHTYDYHNISKNEDETPILLTYTKADEIIALPMLLRSIPNTEYFDLTSVYGYAGPLSNFDTETYNFDDFKAAFNTYLEAKSIVSVFSRLHPYIQQDKILENLGDTISLGDVVNIDVSLPIEQSRMAYGKSNKNQINKLRKQCEVIKVETKEEILEFVDIYYENMKRLDAKESYFFSKEYFLNFMEISDFDTDILLVRHLESNEFVAGSMFVKTKNIVQYHLSGTRTEHLRLKPSKLFLDEMRLRATEQGYKVFNLGGGLGSEHDSLFEFKASFSKDFRTFKVWKYIVNQNVYDTLSQSKDETGFFPKYRS
ncbi:peptidoglycan bridge formation glycyltransferase FemA/FemB family protein [Winogradskyella sp. Asnod2-B02-A]|uniref:peptidoglycan bridge formation glycyltransferase FemA/FemB family protein n=1 Tax=Winogradskyella sp. Asnod2-B02-A TaxID=3160583 RepID=UPI00386F4907